MSEKTLPTATSFAPPMTEERLKAYRAIIKAQPSGPVKHAMEVCLACVEKWWVLPESKQKPTANGLANVSGLGSHTFDVRPLEPDHIEKLDEHVPWDYECTAMNELFEALPTGLQEVPATPDKHAYNKVVDKAAADLRNAAKHLVWFAGELARDREPLTQEVLVAK